MFAPKLGEPPSVLYRLWVREGRFDFTRSLERYRKLAAERQEAA